MSDFKLWWDKQVYAGSEGSMAAAEMAWDSQQEIIYEMKEGLRKSLATINYLCETHCIEEPHGNIAKIKEALWADTRRG